MTFSEGAMAVDFFIRTSNTNSTGQVQIIDSSGAIVEDITGTIVSSSWLQVSKTLVDGDPLMTSITVSAFGNNMLAVDDLSFSTAASGDGAMDDPVPDDDSQGTSGGIYGDTGSSSDSGSGGGAFYCLALLSAFLKRSRSNQKINSHHQ